MEIGCESNAQNLGAFSEETNHNLPKEIVDMASLNEVFLTKAWILGEGLVQKISFLT